MGVKCEVAYSYFVSKVRDPILEGWHVVLEMLGLGVSCIVF